MGIDRDKIVTQDEMDEPAPMDLVDERVEAEMKVIEGRAKEQVAHGLQNEKLDREAQRLQDEGERELDAVKSAQEK